MRWLLKQGNILDEPADVLICPANVSMNLSGGIGAELLGRYGVAQQDALHAILASRSPRCAERGEVIHYAGQEIPYRAILHAVAIDGWYESSPEVIEQIVRKSLGIAANCGARRVALAALATGFGRLTLQDFAAGVRPLLSLELPPVEDAIICLLEDYRLAELSTYLPDVMRPSRRG
jgi:O-acetyl-ADP-ribose deacetylase (regulator of RNase III)